MFTGLIRELGIVDNFSGEKLSIKAKYKPQVGDSIAINGVCLTAVSVENGIFCVELSNETRSKIAFENFKNKVHIEPAMKLSDRLDGHIVQGHVDGIGVIEKIEKVKNSYDIVMKIPNDIMTFMIPKGSVAIDGVSLTINEVFSQSIRLTIIPHTFLNTLFKDYKIGSRVNIESDMFARYLFFMTKGKKNISWDEVDRILGQY